MGASTAPAVKAALLTLLQADGALSGVQIVYSHPGATVQKEAIYFEGTHGQEEPATLGTRKQLETYDIEVAVGVVTDGDQAQAGEERCWALVARLESIVRAQGGLPAGPVSLAMPGGGFAVMGGTEMTPYILGNSQRLAHAVCRVHVEGYKTP